MRTEEEDFKELEEKIGSKTIDCRKEVTAEMRKWFRDRFEFCADDCSVLKRWKEKEAA